jgi:AbrB family looped-hinge helix DNA binding protein
MDTTRLSTKGQIVLPRKIRSSRAWKPGMEFTIEETSAGILLRPANRFPRADLGEVAGCLRSRPRVKVPAKGKESAETRAAIAREVERRHDRGRY